MSRLLPLLAELPGLDGLAPADLAAVADGCQELQLRPGEVLFEEGADDPRVAILLRGRLTRMHRRRPTGSIDPGEIWGAVEALHRTPHAEAIVAAERSQLVLLRASSLELLSLSHAPIGLAIQQAVVGALLDRMQALQRERGAP